MVNVDNLRHWSTSLFSWIILEHRINKHLVNVGFNYLFRVRGKLFEFENAESMMIFAYQLAIWYFGSTWGSCDYVNELHYNLLAK